MKPEMKTGQEVDLPAGEECAEESLPLFLHRQPNRRKWEGAA